MKKFVITLLILIVSITLWITLGVKKADRNSFLSSSTLDIAQPLNVSIDVEFINKLNPAYGK
jgi:hypothetical protein